MLGTRAESERSIISCIISCGLQTYSATYLSAKQNQGVFQVISDKTFLCEISCLPVFVAKKRMPFNMDTTGMRDI